LVETSVAPASYRGLFDSAGEPLQELSLLNPEDQHRIELPCEELNRVLGGGLVAGSVALLAGEPGVGKSTLLLQIAQLMAREGRAVLYISGEESPHQIKLRAERLGFPGQGIFLLSETDVDRVVARLEECRPALAIVDSIQTLYTQDAPSGPGSVVQVRECGLRLTRWAKLRNVPVFLAGHVTKDGSLAGPRVLEHMVDVVMYLEGQDLNTYRLLRNSKNRFGSTTEVGVFEMTGHGLVEVPDPSQALLALRAERAVGSALVPVLEGTRPLLLEIQALTSRSMLPVPRRIANGVDHNRLLMLTAVATRRAGLELSGEDVIVSVAGGFRVSEPAADLAVMLAMASSLYNVPLDPKLVVLGEVGLSGELRPVSQVQRRLLEASRLGLTRCILPEMARGDFDPPPGVEAVFAGTLRQAVRAGLPSARKRREAAATAPTAAPDGLEGEPTNWGDLGFDQASHPRYPG
jgi:DNA repair protein RadA/Sms